MTGPSHQGIGGRRGAPALAVLLLTLAALAAYHNSFHGPFVFDDLEGIVANPTLRRLADSLHPAANTTASGRPVLSVSLGLNYAAGGLSVAGYHAANLAIHLAAGLVLFGIARRTCARVLAPSRAAEGGDSATAFGFAVALLWLLHPLQTESVTYVIQRAESLMGLFYLLTLYGFIRHAEAGGLPWACVCIGSCLLGMMTKEVMVSAPVIVVLYDVAFVSGGVREAWRRHKGLFLALAATWIALALAAGSAGSRNGTSGFGSGVPWGDYERTQIRAVARYLGLFVWPHPLVFDYGTQWSAWDPALVAEAALVAALGAATLLAWRRSPRLAFLGTWFFAILAPTSLVPGNRQTMAEHRMYLALVPLVALAVWAVGTALGRKSLVLCLGAAAALGLLTERRNEIYRSAVGLWADTLARVPESAYAMNNLGYELARAGRVTEAVSFLQRAVEAKPDYPEAENNLAAALGRLGRFAEAIPHAERAARLEPALAEAYGNLAAALLKTGRVPEAIERSRTAVALMPDYAGGQFNLGLSFAMAGRFAEAVEPLRACLRLEPGNADAWADLGNCLAALHRGPEAADAYAEALRFNPSLVAARLELGGLLMASGRIPEAIARYEEGLSLDPSRADLHVNLGVALAKCGRTAEALAQYEAALRLDPSQAEAHANLGVALAAAGNLAQAIQEFEAVVRLKPGFAEGRHDLGAVLRAAGREREAQEQFAAEERIKAGGAPR